MTESAHVSHLFIDHERLPAHESNEYIKLHVLGDLCRYCGAVPSSLNGITLAALLPKVEDWLRVIVQDAAPLGDVTDASHELDRLSQSDVPSSEQSPVASAVDELCFGQGLAIPFRTWKREVIVQAFSTFERNSDFTLTRLFNNSIVFVGE